jgi:hypothetical protein
MSDQRKAATQSKDNTKPSVLRQPPVLGRVGVFGYEDPEALPFAIEFHEVLPAPGAPPSLHSFQSATVDSGHWIMIGGRGAPHGATQEQLSMTGEHTFNPSAAPHPENFPKASFNKMIWVYHPVTGEMATFDTHDLPGEIGVALRATSQQSWYDRESGDLWIIIWSRKITMPKPLELPKIFGILFNTRPATQSLPPRIFQSHPIMNCIKSGKRMLTRVLMKH